MQAPNIIFILSDQHNPYYGGFAGNDIVDTPNLDQLAGEGIVFDNCYCNSPLCVPSRSSMLSGLLPVNTGVYSNLQCLRTDAATFATCLTAGGYETVLSGRMHFVGFDQRHGFEKRLVGDVTPSFPRPGRQKQLYGILHGTPDQSRVCLEKSGAGQSAVTCYDREVTDAAIAWIKNRKDSRPLFMTVGYYNPHCPFVAPESFYHKYYKRLKDSCKAEQQDMRSLHPEIRKFIELRGIEQVSDEELHRTKAAYFANIEYMDHLIGEVIQCVKEYLGLENTVIIYGSDHGEMLGEHGMFWKSNFYEGSARVPFIVSWQGHFRKGVRAKELVSLIDLAPTLLDITSAPHLPAEDGTSLLPLLTGDGVWKDKTVLSMLIDIKGDSPSAMIRKGKYKLIKWCNCELPMLFNLDADPHERVNLAENVEYHEQVKELLDELMLSWNEKDAIARLNEGKQHGYLLKKWTSVAELDCPDEWWCSAENNYLL